MVCLTLIPVLILTWIAADNTLASVEKEIIDANTTRVNWAGQYLEELILSFDDLFYSLQINQNLIDVFEKDDHDLRVLNLQKTLISAYYPNSRIINKLDLYIHSSGEEISVDAVRSGEISTPDIRKGKWTPILNGPVNLRLVPETDSIYAIHSINRFENRELLGGMAVRINRGVIEYIMEILKSEYGGDVFLLNETGQLLSASSHADLSKKIWNLINSVDVKNSETIVFTHEKNLVFLKVLREDRLTILKTIPLELIDSGSRKILKAGLLTSGVLILASLFLAILFSLRISKPIISLANTMEQTSLLDFEHLKVESHDEVGMLEKGYNSLMQRMKDLVEKDYQSEIDLRNARLNALHAQINPHFLYNTLQLIGGMALAKEAPEIYQVSKAVGDLFRYTTASEGELVFLEKEMTHIENYLMIQEMRFKGKCSVNFDVQNSVRETLIPQFTLQPIVENAFEHGFQSKRGKWNIFIRASRQKRGILLVIEDDGVGMASERLSSLRYLLSRKIIVNNTSESHIGLKNVDTRLKLHFGKQYGLKIFSTAEKGSRIIIRLPDSLKG